MMWLYMRWLPIVHTMAHTRGARRRSPPAAAEISTAGPLGAAWGVVAHGFQSLHRNSWQHWQTRQRSPQDLHSNVLYHTATYHTLLYHTRICQNIPKVHTILKRLLASGFLVGALHLMRHRHSYSPTLQAPGSVLPSQPLHSLTERHTSLL